MQINSDKKLHWNNFYKKFDLLSESSFSRFIIKWLKNNQFRITGKTLIDIGCGNSRDTKYFKKKKLDVVGIDQSFTAIELNKKNYPNIEFYNKNICRKNFNLKNKKFDYLYARFFLHAISSKEETMFLKNCKKISKKNSILMFEFRTIKDSLMNKGIKLKGTERFYGHYRRFVDTKKFIKKFNNFDLKILYMSQSRNYAKFKKEQPHICRIIAKKIK